MRLLQLIVRFLLSIVPLVVVSFAHAKVTKEKKKSKKQPTLDPQCRHITHNDEPIATAEVIVVGSGPGGTGFLYRLLKLKPNLSIIWIEQGYDFVARNWPDDIESINGAVLTPFPRTTMNWLTGYGWKNFGGGDAGNSGGANILLTNDESPEEEDYVFNLRNNSVIPLTTTSQRWVEGFLKSGFTKLDPQRVKTSQDKTISQPSSLRTEDGRERLLIANELRYSTSKYNITYVHARAASVIREDILGRNKAVGIRGVRLAYNVEFNKQQEYGGCVAWAATKAVVLAGGVFNTFDLLVESGIGPQDSLKARKIPTNWWSPNEHVGKGVGDEHAVVFVSVEPNEADPFGAQPRLIAYDEKGSAYELWTKGLYAWLRFKDFRSNILLGKILPKWFPKVYGWLDFLLEGCNMWGIGIDSGEPMIKLEAIPKPGNSTLLLPFFPPAVERYMNYPFQSPLTVIRKSLQYKFGNPVGLLVDDSNIQMTDDMCEAIKLAMIPMEEGAKSQKDVKPVSFKTKARRFKLWLATKLGLNTSPLLKPHFVTPYNVPSYTSSTREKRQGRKCSTNMLASYYHYFGGNANNVVDKESYQVYGTKHLYISDASILRRLSPGPPSSTVMQAGMNVADAFVAELIEDDE